MNEDMFQPILTQQAVLMILASTEIQPSSVRISDCSGFLEMEISRQAYQIPRLLASHATLQTVGFGPVAIGVIWSNYKLGRPDPDKSLEYYAIDHLERVIDDDSLDRTDPQWTQVLAEMGFIGNIPDMIRRVGYEITQRDNQYSVTIEDVVRWARLYLESRFQVYTQLNSQIFDQGRSIYNCLVDLGEGNVLSEIRQRMR